MITQKICYMVLYLIGNNNINFIHQYFDNAKVVGLGEIYVQQKFSAL